MLSNKFLKKVINEADEEQQGLEQYYDRLPE